MEDIEYGLGIDIGDDVVSAAVCPRGEALASTITVPGPAATVEFRADGSVRLGEEPLPPGDRVAAHVMARVGTPAPLWLGGRAVPASAVAAAIVVAVRNLAAADQGRPPTRTVVTVPPSWGAYRTAELAAALGGDAGSTSVVSSAVAVTRHHVESGDLPGDPTVAVYDAGASTLDTAVVGRTADGSLGHLSPPPPALPWGGADVDDVLLAHVRGWLDPLTDSSGTTSAHALRAGVVAAKTALSTDTVAQLAVGTDDPLRITREELDELLAPDVERTVLHLQATVEAAGLDGNDLDAVVLAGGCARIPLVAETVSAALGRPVVVGSEPEADAALGAARLAADSLAIAAVPDEEPDRRVVVPTARVTPARSPRALTRPPVGAGAGSPAGRRPSGREPRRRIARVMTVAAMFTALAVLVPSLLTVIGAMVGGKPTGSPAAAGAAPSAAPNTARPAETPGPGADVFAGADVQDAAVTRSAGPSQERAASATGGTSARTSSQQATQGDATATATADGVPATAATTPDVPPATPAATSAPPAPQSTPPPSTPAPEPQPETPADPAPSTEAPPPEPPPAEPTLPPEPDAAQPTAEEPPATAEEPPVAGGETP